MKNRLTDLDINDPFYKANKDGLETRAIETCGEALEVVKAVQKQIAEDKVDEEGKPTAEYPCMCKGLANPYCPYHSDPNSPLQKEFDKIFRETYKTEPIILTKKHNEGGPCYWCSIGKCPKSEPLQDKVEENHIVQMDEMVEPLQDEWKEELKLLWKISFENEKGTNPRTNIEMFIEKLLTTQKAEIRKMVEGKLPDIGIMASMSFSSEATHYVNGYDKAKSDFLVDLDKLK